MRTEGLQFVERVARFVACVVAAVLSGCVSQTDVNGRVLTLNGSPLVGGRVILNVEQRVSLLDMNILKFGARTNLNGAFCFEGVHARACLVEAHADGYIPRSVRGCVDPVIQLAACNVFDGFAQGYAEYGFKDGVPFGVGRRGEYVDTREAAVLWPIAIDAEDGAVIAETANGTTCVLVKRQESAADDVWWFENIRIAQVDGYGPGRVSAASMQAMVLRTESPSGVRFMKIGKVLRRFMTGSNSASVRVKFVVNLAGGRELGAPISKAFTGGYATGDVRWQE